MTKAEKTRQFIIEKSAPLFNTRGVAGTAMSDIMEATKLAKGSLYVHFQNKDELAYSAVDYNLNTLAKGIMGATNKYTTARDKLFAVLDFLGDPLHPPLVGGCPMLNFGMEGDDTDPVIRKMVHKIVEAIQQGVMAIVEQGMASGEFKRGWNVGEFAIRTFALIEGGIFLSRVSGNNKQMDIIVGTIKREIMEQVC